jgi:hypothetical protein
MSSRAGGKKRDQYYKRVIKRHYGGELRGLAHAQLFRQRGLRGTTLGPANPGRRPNNRAWLVSERRGLVALVSVPSRP